MNRTDMYRYMLAAKLHTYVGKHEDALRVLTAGIAAHPDLPHLYRHRGHFRVSVRDFDGAIEDFKAAVARLDGMPDEIEYYQAELVPEMERTILGGESELLASPTPITPENLERLKDVYKGTLKSSTWYHYGVGNWYLTEGDEAAAVRVFERILQKGDRFAFGTIAAETDLKRLKAA